MRARSWSVVFCLCSLGSLVLDGCAYRTNEKADANGVVVTQKPPLNSPVAVPETTEVPSVAVASKAKPGISNLPVVDSPPADSTNAPATDRPQTADPTPAETPSKAPMTLKQILKMCGTGVVMVSSLDALGDTIGFGSGCIVGPGLILTNYHVVSSAAIVQVKPRGTGDELLGAAINVVGYRAIDEDNDLALLQVESLPNSLHVFTVADPERVEQFDKVFAIGHPEGLKFTTTTGHINGIIKSSDLPEQFQVYVRSQETHWIQTDAVIAGGSSGGPLVNEQGEIVGINTLQFSNRSSMAVSGLHVEQILSHQSDPVVQFPVPDANVLMTKAVAEIKRGYDQEQIQLQRDSAPLKEAKDAAKLRQLVRKNNPGPDCILRCIELVKSHRGKPEAVDAIQLCVEILSKPVERRASGRHYFDDLLDEAAVDSSLIDPTVRTISKLNNLSDSPALQRYLRSVLDGQSSDEVKCEAGGALASVMSQNVKQSAELAELAQSLMGRFGTMEYRGAPLNEFLKSILELRAFQVGSTAPDIVGKDAEDREFRLSDYRGKVILLDFWADWCPHCRNMYPLERELIETLKDRPFALLGVNCDEVDRAKRATTSGNVTWRSWMDGPGGPIATQYRIEGFPTIYILDAEGRIRFTNLRGEQLKAAILSLLDGTSDSLVPQNVVATDANWSFLSVQKDDEVVGWRSAAFDDSAWKSGSGPIGYETENVATKLQHAEPGRRPPTTLFRHKFNLPEGELSKSLLMRLRYQDGIAVYLNDSEIYRDHLKSDAGIETNATVRITDSAARGIVVPIDSDLLQPTDNCIAVELHQFSPYSAKALFELTLGTLPDLQALMNDASDARQVEIFQLLGQAGTEFPASSSILKKYQSRSLPYEIQIRAAIAAAMNRFPVTVKESANPDDHGIVFYAVSQLNQDAWETVEQEGLSDGEYARALRKAFAAHELVPAIPEKYRAGAGGVTNTLGIAMYRCGQYARAQTVLRQSIREVGDNPSDVAFLAMAARKLNERDEADEHRQHLMELVNGDEWKHDEDSRQLVREVDKAFAEK